MQKKYGIATISKKISGGKYEYSDFRYDTKKVERFFKDCGTRITVKDAYCKGCGKKLSE